MSNRLDLRLFGSPHITWQDKTITGFVSNKARALLIYLAGTHSAHSRDRLAELLWSDTPDTARANLRRALGNLRSLTGITFREDSSQLVALDFEHCWVDVIEFEALADSFDDGDKLAAWTRAAQLYREDFLVGFNPSLSYEFEAWVLGKQARLKEQMVEMLHQLANGYARHNHLPQAIAAMRRLLQLEPWREEAHRRLIELLALNNDTGAALTAFETCRQRLREELDVEPSAATLELVAQIRTGVFQRTVRSIAHTQVATPVEFQPAGRDIERFYTHLPAQESASAVAVTLQPQPGRIALVGRHEVWRQLMGAWQETLRGSAQLLLLTGEAGIGKTRLAEELLAWVAQQGFATAQSRSYAVEGSLSYAPVIAWLRSDALRARLETLERGWLSEVARLLPELLTERPTLPHPEPLAEHWQRQRLFDALAHAFLAGEGPLLLLIDDLQWCDGETLAWLHYLLRQELRAPILVVGTVRMEGTAEMDHRLHALIQALHASEQVRELELCALDEEVTTELAATLIGRTPDPTWAARLYRFTQGNALFVVEIVRASLEDGTQSKDTLPWSTTLPPKIQAVIQARLDRLSTAARELAALAAAVGRSFTLPLLVAASRIGEETVVAALDELWQRRFVREEEVGIYGFGHERLRETIYGEISPMRRQTLHQRIAQALEQLHQEGPETVAAQLAFHYTQAMQAQLAVSWYRRAAAEAHKVYALADAATYTRSGLAQLERMAETSERMNLELEMLLELGRDMRLITTFSEPQLRPILSRAYALAQQVGNSHHLFMATLRYLSYLRSSGERTQARRLTEQLLQIAEKTQDPRYQAEAYFENARLHILLGNFALTPEWHYQAKALYTPAVAQFGSPLASHDASLAFVLWVLGYPQQAIRELEEAVAEIEHVQHPGHIAVALRLCADVYQALRDVASVQRLAERMAEVGARFDLGTAVHNARIYLAWTKGQQGNPGDGIELVRQSIDFFRRLGQTTFYTCSLAILAELYLQVGDLAAAQAAIAEALTVSETKEEHQWDAELFRLQGHILLAQGAPASVIEGSYQQALAIARKQEARSLELRAAMSLARLWLGQEQPQQAYQLLAAIYGWFTEGQETCDLLEARNLLAELQATDSF